MQTRIQTLSRIVFFVRALVLCLMVAMVAIDGECVFAQTGMRQTRPPSVGVTVQLPVFQIHSISTAVSVPDGGTISLGGVGRSNYGRSSQSGFGRQPSRNRFGSRSPTGATLSARIIRMKEFEKQMLADHAAGRPQACDVRVNGSHAVQAKADFISRNVGR